MRLLVYLSKISWAYIMAFFVGTNCVVASAYFFVVEQKTSEMQSELSEVKTKVLLDLEKTNRFMLDSISEVQNETEIDTSQMIRVQDTVRVPFPVNLTIIDAPFKKPTNAKSVMFYSELTDQIRYITPPIRAIMDKYGYTIDTLLISQIPEFCEVRFTIGSGFPTAEKAIQINNELKKYLDPLNHKPIIIGIYKGERISQTEAKMIKEINGQ